MIAADIPNSTQDFLTTNILIKGGGYIKAINYYAQPDRRRNSLKALAKMVKRIRQAEPGIQIIIGGDFNHQMAESDDPDFQLLEPYLLKIINNN